MCFPQIVCAKSRRKISQNKEAIFIELVSTHVFKSKLHNVIKKISDYEGKNELKILVQNSLKNDPV